MILRIASWRGVARGKQGFLIMSIWVWYKVIWKTKTRIHPTQKPTQLIIQLLNHYTKENDLILDPFTGSFTTAVACHKMQRRFIGAELDKEYFEKGYARLNKAQSQISLFDLWKSLDNHKNTWYNIGNSNTDYLL